MKNSIKLSLLVLPLMVFSTQSWAWPWSTYPGVSSQQMRQLYIKHGGNTEAAKAEARALLIDAVEKLCQSEGKYATNIDVKLRYDGVKAQEAHQILDQFGNTRHVRLSGEQWGPAVSYYGNLVPHMIAEKYPCKSGFELSQSGAIRPPNHRVNVADNPNGANVAHNANAATSANVSPHAVAFRPNYVMQYPMAHQPMQNQNVMGQQRPSYCVYVCGGYYILSPVGWKTCNNPNNYTTNPYNPQPAQNANPTGQDLERFKNYFKNNEQALLNFLNEMGYDAGDSGPATKPNVSTGPTTANPAAQPVKPTQSAGDSTDEDTAEEEPSHKLSDWVLKDKWRKQLIESLKLVNEAASHLMPVDEVCKLTKPTASGDKGKKKVRFDVDTDGITPSAKPSSKENKVGVLLFGKKDGNKYVLFVKKKGEEKWSLVNHSASKETYAESAKKALKEKIGESYDYKVKKIEQSQFQVVDDGKTRKMNFFVRVGDLKTRTELLGKVGEKIEDVAWVKKDDLEKAIKKSQKEIQSEDFDKNKVKIKIDGDTLRALKEAKENSNFLK